ncbi:LysR family transcriptional regulator [Nesterenkonia alkaliphila]|uniref:LysR family transcriptional regulator n=1 Tax=Nesterenkonia alkaliphila TaxID=1463631 RepID=A0A7K1UJS7_9MICC|nr:LysR family transcriptional regulator [Nesterenkonia alkaliphila]MVT26654.1 LysR family transcriptional regulator [Nesterenkonia alkaliphila]
MDELMKSLAPQLRALTEVAAQGGHMTGAASALGIPQSSMSRRIHALEETLHMPLLIREGRTVRLTPSALRLAQLVRVSLHEIEMSIAQVTETADPDHGTVRFGFPLTMGSGAVPDMLAEFNLKHPGIRLQLKQAHGSALIEDLRNGGLDLAITIPPPTDLEHTILTTQQINAVLPEDHPLANRACIQLEDLEGARFIANPSSYNLRQLTERWCRRAGYEPNIGIEITEFATIRELISRGLGVALLPHSNRRVDGTLEVPLIGEDHTRKIALTSATLTQTAVTQRLNDFILARGLS